ncbi:MAG TPA: CPBP family intramembrane glutamic endopeptidase [Bacillota bacterium]
MARPVKPGKPASRPNRLRAAAQFAGTRRQPSVVTMALISMVFFGTLGIFVAWVVRQPIRLAAFDLTLRGVLLAAGGAAVCFVIAVVMYSLWPALRVTTDGTAVEVIRTSLAQVGWFGMLLSVTLPPIGEEILFRGAIQPVAGLTLTSALFGLSHGGWAKVTWPYAVSAAISGLVLGTVYQLTGSLMASILTHMVYNVAVSVGMAERWWPFGVGVPAGPMK